MKDKYPYQAIYERDNFTCQYCGISGASDFEAWWHANLTIDHIKPKKHGGATNDPNNLVVSCRSCNHYKGQEDCANIEDAKRIVVRKRKEAQLWFERFVKNRDSL